MDGYNFKRKFGQNFLTRQSWATELVDLAGIKAGDLLIEVGPGQGIVTEKLLATGNEVYACEIDHELYLFLEKKFAAAKNFHLITEDILRWNFTEITAKKPFRVVASLPYNIAKKVINLFLMAQDPPQAMALIVQNEVAEKYTAKAPDATFLGQAAKVYSHIKFCGRIPKEEFQPEPKVDGGMLLFTMTAPVVKKPEQFIKFMKIGFSSPRKKLSSNLSNAGYDKASIEKQLKTMQLPVTARPQELTLEQWLKIYTLTADAY